MCKNGHTPISHYVSMCLGLAVVVGCRRMMVCILVLGLDNDESLWSGAESAFVEPEPDYGGAYEEEVATYANDEDEQGV